MWGRRNGMRAALSPVVWVAALALLLVACGGSSHTVGSSNAGPLHPRPDDIASVGGTRVEYRATANGSVPATPTQVAQAVEIIRGRIAALHADAFANQAGDAVEIDLPRYRGAAPSPLLERLTGDGRLTFIDWEANALTPNGMTVARQLLAQIPPATEISQGSASAAPGSPGVGSLGLYAAIKLAEAAKHPPVGAFNARPYALDYSFATAGSSACRTAAAAYGYAPLPRQPCYLAGPAATRADLRASLPPGIGARDAQTLEVPRGVLILQAVPQSLSAPAAISNPTTQFFTLLDRAALSGSAIVNPQRSSDATGAPDLSFGFTPAGGTAFQQVTAVIAQRGALDSGVTATLNQHFAVALDGQLLTVPLIDFHVFPDGIRSSNGAQIAGGFTVASAEGLAAELRLGVLPVTLDLIARRQVPAGG